MLLSADGPAAEHWRNRPEEPGEGRTCFTELMMSPPGPITSLPPWSNHVSPLSPPLVQSRASLFQASLKAAAPRKAEPGTRALLNASLKTYRSVRHTQPIRSQTIRAHPPQPIRAHPPQPIRAHPPQPIGAHPPQPIRAHPPQPLGSLPSEPIRSQPPRPIRSLSSDFISPPGNLASVLLGLVQ